MHEPYNKFPEAESLIYVNVIEVLLLLSKNIHVGLQ